MIMYCKDVIVRHSMERNEKVLKHATSSRLSLSRCFLSLKSKISMC